MILPQERKKAMNYSSFDPWTSSNAKKRDVYNRFLAMHMEGDEDVEIPSDLATAFKKLCAWGFINDCKTEIEDSSKELTIRLICSISRGALPTWIEPICLLMPRIRLRTEMWVVGDEWPAARCA